MTMYNGSKGTRLTRLIEAAETVCIRYGVLPSLEPFARIFFHTINFLRWGEHRGGMFVEIEGREPNGRSIKRSWHLLAEGDDGPFIPSMAIEAIIRNWVNGQKPRAGARAALEELEVSDYEKLFSKRQIFTATRLLEAAAGRCLYQRLLGEAWHTLPKTLKALHSAPPRPQMGGKATVTRGTGVLARAVARIFAFPQAADSVDVTVTFHHTNESEFWNRNFGGQTFSSIQYEGQGRYKNLLCEQFGPFVFGMALVRDSNRVRFVVRRWSIFGIPLPRRLAPTGDSFEFEEEGVFRFHVEVRSPIAGLIVRYAGYLERL